MSDLTLYDIEDSLLAFLDTQDVVPAEQREAFERDLAEQIKTAVDKRQRCVEFIRFCELQSEAARAEVKRLQDRSATFDHAADRLKSYIAGVIESLGTDGKGKYRKLEGRTVTFGVSQNPPSVVITDVNELPERFKRTTVSVSIDKQAIKKAINSGETVPGADLKFGDMRLELK